MVWLIFARDFVSENTVTEGMCIQGGEIELPCKHYLAHSQYNKENDCMIKLLCELVFFLYGTLL